MNTTPMIPEIKSDTAATSITRADRKEKDGSFAQIFEVMKKDQASVQRDRVQKPEEKRDEPKSVKKKTKQESEGTTDAAPATEKHCEVHDQQQTSKDNDSQEKGQAAAYNKTLADSTTSTQSKGAGEATVSSKDLASSILHANQDLNLLVKLKDTSANSFQLLKTQSLSDGKNPAPLFDNKGKQAVELVHSNAKAAEKAELPVRVDEQIPTIEPESKTASEKSNAESTASVAAKNVETAQAPPIDKLDATAAFRDTLNQTRESGTAHRKDAATSEDAKAQSSQEMDAQAATQQVQKQGQAESADGKMGADTTKDAMSTFARRLTVDAAKSDTQAMKLVRLFLITANI